MTRPNLLVLDGEQVKLRLLAERTETRTPVHVDWLRFTVQRRLTTAPSADLLFGPEPFNVWEAQAHRVHKALAELPDAEHWVGAEALQLAQDVCQALGDEFSVAAEVRKGHDFYRHRWSIERNAVEVGWIGFLASSTSPRQQAQAKTMHVNLYGAACTFAAAGWMECMALLIAGRDGDITRADLALDFFDGLPLDDGMESVRAEYMAGLMDVSGKRPKCSMVGDWCNGQERSFYIGSKQAGKQTNVYEKGHQLFGADSGSLWTRIELRYGNKLRVLPVDLLRRPADFFAGASEWHARMLSLVEPPPEFVPEPIKTTARLADKTADAALYRVGRWVADVAMPAVSLLLSVGGDQFVSDLYTEQRPHRLRGFSMSQLTAAVPRVLEQITRPFAAGHGDDGLQPLAA